MVTGRKRLMLVILFCLLAFSACSGGQVNQAVKPALLANSLQLPQKPTPTTPHLPATEQAQKPTPPPPTATPILQPTATPVEVSPGTAGATAPGTLPAMTIPITGPGVAPYGTPPQMSLEEVQLTQKLFALINSDRAARGLYAYTWNITLSGGARLHSWNMFHCGFSHTCPDGRPQCDRIASEGFAGYTDCGENIAYAGPFPSAWEGTYKIQESMVNEPPTGWHRIHLFSTTLHHVGVGVFVDPQGYIWFTEDMVS